MSVFVVAKLSDTRLFFDRDQGSCEVSVNDAVRPIVERIKPTTELHNKQGNSMGSFQWVDNQSGVFARLFLCSFGAVLF